MNYKKNGYIIYHSHIIQDYTFVPININDFDGNLYEKKIVTKNNLEIYFQNEKFILKNGTHYFPTLSSLHTLLIHNNYSLLNDQEKNDLLKNVEIYKIYKPSELIVSKIYKDKQIIIDKFFKDDNHTKSISHISSFYTLFITNITHHKYNYIFSIYDNILTFSKYLQINHTVKDSINYQVYNSSNYIEKRINHIEYKGKIKNVINDESIVENILTSLNNQKIIEDNYINTHLLEYKYENDNSNFLKIKYYNKDHNILRKKLKDEYMIILRPPKFDEYIDLYEPYSDDKIQEMWKSHFDIIESLENDKVITFCIV